MRTKWGLIALVACLALVGLAPLASSAPDGLERVASAQGFKALEQESPLKILAGYAFPGLENETLSTILAGSVGVLVLFALTYGLAWLIRRRNHRATQLP